MKKKKNFDVQNRFGLLPNYIVKKKKNLYCNVEIVLQEQERRLWDCVAIQYFVL